MAEYKPNSHKYKEDQAEKRVKKVVNGKVKTKKKSEVHKLADIFIAEDVSNVKSYIFMDVLVPAIKKAISDIVRDGVDMILYGGSGRSKKSGSTYVSYRDYSKKDDGRYSNGAIVRNRFSYDDIVFENRGEAEAVLEQMIDIIDSYGFVTVADMYDMANLAQPYTSNKYGWTSIRNAEPVRIAGGGYILKLPRATPID